MSTEENKALVRRFLDGVWNEADLDLIEEFLAPTYVNHDPSHAGHVPGPAIYRQVASTFRTSFPDLHTTIEDMIAEGDKVVVRGTDQFTSTSEFMGIPPTGTQVTVAWIGIYRVASGRIVEEWINTGSPGTA